MPGTANITQYQLKSWAGNDLLKIDDVTERNDTIRMLLAGTKFKLAALEPVLVSDIQDSSFVATWQNVPDAKQYAVSAYTLDKNGNRQYVGGLNTKIFMQPEELKVDGLLPLTDYHFDVAAKLASYTSDTASVDAQTLPLAFVKKIPDGLAASDITSSGFKATWNELDGATDYLVSLFNQEYSSER